MDTEERKVEEKLNQTNPNQNEGYVATKLEQQTAKIPSDIYLWSALASMIASLILKILKQNSTAIFIGQWAPSFLLIGIYNKLVKQQGHD